MGFRKLNGLKLWWRSNQGPKDTDRSTNNRMLCCYIYIYIYIEKKNCFSNFLQIEAQASGCTRPASDV